MKVKTSVTLSEDVVEGIDRLASRHNRNRSDMIEAAVRAFIEQLARQDRDARDLEILNRRADDLNQETGDVLEYQVPL